MIRTIHHVAVAVRSLEEALRFWSEILGLDVSDIETVPGEGVKVAMMPVGESRVELLEATGPDSPVARFLERRGPGLHHLTFRVDDLDGILERLREAGIRFAGEPGRTGAGGTRVAFLHPGSTGGVLVELVEETAEDAGGGVLGPGAPVLVYLQDPQEKLWGLLRRLDAAGVMLEGIDLASFDDWVAQIERREESVVGPSALFVPARRIEKILLDRPSGNLPSLAERFYRRTGRRVEEVLRNL